MSVSSAAAGATRSVSLPERARLAVVWTTGLNLFRDIVQFGVMLVMVRRLPHEAYGQFGLVNTILGFMMVFSSREFIAHTLVIREDADLNYGEQFLAGCVVQTTLCLGCNAVALALWRSPAYAPVAPLLHAMSPIFLLDLPSELRVRMLERALEWRRLRTIEAAGVTGAAALTLVLGLAGAGVYALLIPSFVVPTAFAIDLFLVAGWRPTWRWRPERYRASRRFGTQRVLSVSFVSASNLVESTILARSVGYAVLGVFGRAVGMATLLCGRASSLLMASLYPVLARIPPRSESYQRVSGLVLRVVVWFVVPAAALGSLLGSDLVRTLYGSRWLSVIPLVPRRFRPPTACCSRRATRTAAGMRTSGASSGRRSPSSRRYGSVWLPTSGRSPWSMASRWRSCSAGSSPEMAFASPVCAARSFRRPGPRFWPRSSRRPWGAGRCIAPPAS
jgi:O-antigen/teichoic acid export membrane protein